MSDRVDIDLGDGHTLEFVGWAPDRAINPQYKDIPDMERVGAIIRHKTAAGVDCEGSIMFESEVARRVFGARPVWRVECAEPLTLSPSLLCACGDHGWIRQGRWQRA